MRAYHLTTEKWALESMSLRRLKLALLEDMNDPFELLGIEVKTPKDREFFQGGLKPEMNRTIGILCFSLKWSNPVLWSHYADKHRGLCLGFDIPDEHAKKVTYRGQRLKAEIEYDNISNDMDSPGYKLITTKYKHWQYEDEVRLIFPLGPEHIFQHEGPNHFVRYCDLLTLREIVVGVRSKITDQDLLDRLSSEDTGVSIVRCQLAPRSYKIIQKQTVR